MRKDRDNLHRYTPEGLPGRAAVRIGADDADEFVPEVRLDKFGGEAFLTIRHPHARERGGPPERVVGGKVEIAKGKGRGRVTHRFYEVPDPAETPATVVEPTKPSKK